MQNKQTNKRDNKKQETAKQRNMAFTFLLFKLEACHRLDSTNKYNDHNGKPRTSNVWFQNNQDRY